MERPTMPGAARRGLVKTALVGFAVFLASQAVLQVLHWRHLPRHISSFGLQDYSPGPSWWILGILGLSGGLLALGLALRGLPYSQNGYLASWFLLVAGAAVVMLAIFPTDHAPLPTSASGYLHDAAAIFSLTLVCAAMLLLADAGRRDPTWNRVAGSSLGWSAWGAGLSFAWAIGDVMPAPVWYLSAFLQRVLIVYMVGWLVFIGLRVLDAMASPEPAKSSSPTTR